MASNSKKLAELSIQGNTDTSFLDLPGGTTAQRPDPAGSGNLRYNTTTGLTEYYNGQNNWQSIDTPPTVASIAPSGVNLTDTSQSIVITGTNFKTGAAAKAIGSNGSVVNATTTTINSITQITAVFNGTNFTSQSYDLKVSNPGGLSGELANGLTASAAPTWTTGAGNLATFYSDLSGSTTIAASDAEGDSLTYEIAGGSSLYGGLSLNSSTGAITGNPSPDVSSNTTNTFNATASDGTSTISRTFNIIISAPLGSANNPATSAKQLYDAGYTTSGAYYINNVFTGGVAENVYCRMNNNFYGAGTVYHVQKFVPSGHNSSSALSNFSQFSMSNATATLSTLTSSATSESAYNYRYTTNNSGSGASGVRQTGIRASQMPSSGIFIAVDHKMNSHGDGGNPLGDGGPVWDTNLTGDVSSNTNTHSYSTEWQGGYVVGENQANPYYVYGFLYPNNWNNGSGTAENVIWKAGQGTSLASAWTKINSSGSHESFTRAGSSYTINTTDYFGFKHQGWSDVGNSAQTDCNYWIAAAI